MLQAPKIDRRTSHEIARDVRTFLPVYVENWSDLHGGGELADALIHVFARFGEFIVDRLNKTPEKNFLAFLDLLGVSPLPLQAARAPVTFYLAAGATGHALIPAGTQIAAPPGKGEQDPVIFETEKELVVVSAKLESLVVKDGGQDRYTDFGASLTPNLQLPDAAPNTGAVPSTGNVAAIPHILSIRLPAYPVWPPVNVVRLKFALDADLATPIDSRTLRWELCVAGNAMAMMLAPSAVQVPDEDAVKTIALQPSQDGTANLTKSGDVAFKNVSDVPFVVLNGIPGHWLRCRLLTPIKAKGLPESAGMVREEQLPGIKSLTIETLLERAGLPVEQALFNNLKLDFTKDFFPFGEKPKFGDTFYLACREPFSNPDALLTLHVTITNPSTSGLEAALPPVKPQGTKLIWEFWDGKAWTELGTSRMGRISIDRPEDAGTQFSDATQVFSQSGDVTFKFPSPPAQLNLNGQNNYWIRVRIVGGDYGKEARYAPPASGGAPVLTPATFAPPSIRSIKIDYTVNNESPPSAVLTYNDFAYSKVNLQAGSFKPFIPVTPDQVPPSLYFGFTLPSLPAATAAVFPNLPMTLYAGIEPSAVGGTSDQTFDAASATWNYWNGTDWVKCTVLDDTKGIRRSGLIRFLAPPDLALSKQFGQNRYWLRMQGGGLQSQPKFSQVLLNTTMAVQGTTIANEILGASNGTPDQQFMTTHRPVLSGQKLEVREPTQPAWQERLQIRADQGEDAITRVPEPGGKGDAFWVRWLEVPNFYGSGPRDRHYLLDRMSGGVTFGNGANGLIPPALPGNIRISYRTGGGAAGNKPASAIAQLKSAIPYIQKASNCEASSGGTDTEPDLALLDRGPLGIRHGGRAVTREDFENLAMLASREVARAKCVPLCDLTQDPDARIKKPGTVSLIIVPNSTDIRPRPTQDLFDRVRTYLDASRQLTANLVLAVPEYVRVDVECEISVSELEAASEVELAVQKVLVSYLHPVTGGRDSRGWNFGREPKRSDFYGLLESIPGVSHIRELRVTLTPDRPGSDKTGRFLICSGNHKVTTTIEE